LPDCLQNAIDNVYKPVPKGRIFGKREPVITAASPVEILPEPPIPEPLPEKVFADVKEIMKQFRALSKDFKAEPENIFVKKSASAISKSIPVKTNQEKRIQMPSQTSALQDIKPILPIIPSPPIIEDIPALEKLPARSSNDMPDLEKLPAMSSKKILHKNIENVLAKPLGSFF
jgi:hypothetical protein